MDNQLKHQPILLASPFLKGTYFEDAIIWLVEYNKQFGSYGLVINQLAHMPINEVFDNTDSFENPVNYNFNLGGPVQESTYQIVEIGQSTLNNSYEISDNVHIGGDFILSDEFIKNILKQNHLRFFLGYTGWQVGQLENEISENIWEVVNFNIFDFLSLSKEMNKVNVDEFKSIYL